MHIWPLELSKIKLPTGMWSFERFAGLERTYGESKFPADSRPAATKTVRLYSRSKMLNMEHGIQLDEGSSYSYQLYT